MTITAEQLRTQQFTITRFRDGYDMEQVEEFLEALAADYEERDKEKAQLEARIAELEEQLEAARSASATSGAVEEPAAPETAEPAAAEEPASKPHQGYADGDAQKSSAMLQLALELHDKYVSDGETKRDQLIAEGETTAKNLVQEARDERSEVLRVLDTERNTLQTAIDNLRDFENEFRNTLRSYIRSQLEGLEGSVEPAGAPEPNQ